MHQRQQAPGVCARSRLRRRIAGSTLQGHSQAAIERRNRQQILRHARIHDQLASNPQYAGGICKVIRAFEKAKDHVSVPQIATLLAKMKFTYPYHQALGFVLQKVGMSEVGHKLTLNMDHVNSEANHTLDDLGIAKNAREEKIRARDVKHNPDAENARMAKLYREHVLGEKPVEGMVRLDAIAPAKPAKEKESDLVAGD